MTENTPVNFPQHDQTGAEQDGANDVPKQREKR